MAKIKNIEVNIKIANRDIKIKNLILNCLLNRYAKSLIYNFDSNFRLLNCCLVKFDTPIENINENSDLKNSDFDICILSDNYETTFSNNVVYTHYAWSNYIYDYQKGGAPHSWSEYVGKKISTLAFNSNFAKNSNMSVGAILDLTNYDIYIEDSGDISITRLDKISSNGEFFSESPKIKGPVHLAPDRDSRVITFTKI